MTSTSLPQPPHHPDDHRHILEDAREHPERTYSEHIRAAERIAAAEYRAEVRRMMDTGTLDPDIL